MTMGEMTREDELRFLQERLKRWREEGMKCQDLADDIANMIANMTNKK